MNLNIQETLSTWNFEFSQRSALTKADVEGILSSSSLDSTVLCCLIALKKTTPEGQTLLLKVSSFFPEQDKKWINQCLQGNIEGFILAAEGFINHPEVSRYHSNTDLLLAEILNFLILYFKGEDWVMNALLHHQFATLDQRAEVCKRILLNLQMNFITYLPLLVNSRSYKDFLTSVIQPYLKSPEKRISTPQYENLVLEYRREDNNYLDSIRINAKILPKYFFYWIEPIKDIPDSLRAFPRLSKGIISSSEESFLYHPSRTTIQALNYILKSETPDWGSLSYRGVLLEERYLVTANLFPLVNQCYQKHGLKFIKFLLSSTLGCELYDRWVLRKSLLIKDSNSDFLDSLWAFSGIAMANERYLSKTNAHLLLLNVKNNFNSEIIKKTNYKIIKKQPHAIPEELVGEGIVFYTDALNKAKNNTLYSINQQHNNEAIKHNKEEENQIQTILDDLRFRSFKHNDHKTKLKGVLGVHK